MIAIPCDERVIIEPGENRPQLPLALQEIFRFRRFKKGRGLGSFSRTAEWWEAKQVTDAGVSLLARRLALTLLHYLAEGHGESIQKETQGYDTFTGSSRREHGDE